MSNSTSRRKTVPKKITKTLDIENTEEPDEETGIIGNELSEQLYRRLFSLTSNVYNKLWATQTRLNASQAMHLMNAIKNLTEVFPYTKPENKVPEEASEGKHLQGYELPVQKQSTRPQSNVKLPFQHNSALNEGIPGFLFVDSSSSFRDFAFDDNSRDKYYLPSEEDDIQDNPGELSGRVQKPQKEFSEENDSFDEFSNRTDNGHGLLRSRSVDVYPTEHREEPWMKRRNSTDLSEIFLDNDELIPNYCEAILATSPKANDNGSPLKKRRRINPLLEQQKIARNNIKRLKYKVKPGCHKKCLKNCKKYISDKEREDINNQYWTMTWTDRRSFIKASTSIAIPKRKRTMDPQRHPRRSFYFKTKDGDKVDVCKIFFLTTLGFDKNNDKVLYNSIEGTSDIDCRGKHSKAEPSDRTLLTDHIQSFNPKPLYHSEDGPHQRYLPNDISIASMHKDFCLKHPDSNVRYELYRKHLKSLNIIFTP